MINQNLSYRKSSPLERRNKNNFFCKDRDDFLLKELDMSVIGFGDLKWDSTGDGVPGRDPALALPISFPFKHEFSYTIDENFYIAHSEPLHSDTLLYNTC